MIKWTTVEVTTVLTSDHLRRQGRALCHGPELGPGNVRVDGGQLAEGGEPAVRARLHPVTHTRGPQLTIFFKQVPKILLNDP